MADTIVEFKHPLENPQLVDPEKARFPDTVRGRHIRAAAKGGTDAMEQAFCLACSLTGLDAATLDRLHHEDFTAIMEAVESIMGK